MNEQLKVLLNQFGIDLINKVQTGIELGTQFLGKELPLVAQEIINWGIARSIFYTSMWFVITLAFCVLAAVCWYLADRESEGDWFVGSIVLYLCGLVSLLVTFYNAFFIVKIAIAPRVYLIEQLLKMTTSITTGQGLGL